MSAILFLFPIFFGACAEEEDFPTTDETFTESHHQNPPIVDKADSPLEYPQEDAGVEDEPPPDDKIDYTCATATGRYDGEYCPGLDSTLHYDYTTCRYTCAGDPGLPEELVDHVCN
ncbi:hypothetical protein KKG38_05315 [Patescibacteria group bacterium]|nr:hypothetical protein [Patescibacteria group bacterium]MBU1901124.1 hypothetical protein [Patescibacteria group bacterium]